MELKPRASGRLNDELILGLDVGTTNVKGVLFDLSGNELAVAKHSLRLHTPQPGYAELEPEEIWQEVGKSGYD
jgi:sugar (pentulose or hexulose) kinase